MATAILLNWSSLIKKDEKVLKIITDPPKIRKHMTEHFQEIFRGLDLDHNANMVSSFLL